jgi:flagellar P-ring protein precursor FlgI
LALADLIQGATKLKEASMLNMSQLIRKSKRYARAILAPEETNYQEFRGHLSLRHRAEAWLRRRKAQTWLAHSVLGFLFCLIASTSSATRIKDVTQIQGIRSNQLIGYGLVVGLDGSGDGSSTEFTAQSLANFLQRNHITIDPDDIKLKNVAAVVVTADLPAFARRGDRIDVAVSSIGDAKSLQGGTLLMTPLYGAIADRPYAVAQGAISVGGFAAGGGGTSISKNHVTAGKIPSGAIVENESPVQFGDEEIIRLKLNSPDFTTANRIAEVINHNREISIARPLSAAEVAVIVPLEFKTRLPEFMAAIERLPVHPDQRARIVIDERTGTVVMGEDVRISTLALTHGALTIQISSFHDVSQPEPFSETGRTLRVTNTDVAGQEENRELALVEEGVSLGEVVRSLNALGITPRDLISILQSIQTLGALQAELVIR